ncbi:hypothetical protein AKJ65_01490 [candidate division MSBL1 archaeon SCGC-AAA259E19]|uniref:Uncharacterized protein n=1 Tax=candidate division MSBL1 archaeon SCGC-AAA259E19 TaxID=1698264 RepID=A0A133UMR9_9EURY|nr:hypothetical protein AKJ65_01490 [candidate division MSBL1 archaeon SCGC-AAA259E19]
MQSLHRHRKKREKKKKDTKFGEKFKPLEFSEANLAGWQEVLIGQRQLKKSKRREKRRKILV